MSSLLAPIRMVFHSRFVLMNLLGRTVGWKSQGRDDTETSWREAFRHHGLDSLFASAWGGALYWLNPDYFWWVTPDHRRAHPVGARLRLHEPRAARRSRAALGALPASPRRSTRPPSSATCRRSTRRRSRRCGALPPAERDGFVRAVVDPFVNALHRALLGRRRSLRAEHPRTRAPRSIARSLAEGPQALSPRERRVLLHDPDAVDALHERVWALADRAARRALGPAGRQGGRATRHDLASASRRCCSLAHAAPRARDASSRVWAMGREGEVRARAGARVRARASRRPGARAADPVERRAREAADGLRRRRAARRLPGRQHLDPGARGARRARAARRRDRAPDGVDRRLFPGILDTNVVDGRTWGVPWYVDTRVLFYRATVARPAARRRDLGRLAGARSSACRQARGRTRSAILLPLREWQPPVILALQQRGDAAPRRRPLRRLSRARRARAAFAFYLDLFRRGLARRDAATQVDERLPGLRAPAGSRSTSPGRGTSASSRAAAGRRSHGRWATAPMPAPRRRTVRACRSPAARAWSSSAARRGRTRAWRARRVSRRRRRSRPRFYELTGDLPARRARGARRRSRATHARAAFWTQLQAVRATPKIPEWERIATRDRASRRAGGARRRRRSTRRSPRSIATSTRSSRSGAGCSGEADADEARRASSRRGSSSAPALSLILAVFFVGAGARVVRCSRSPTSTSTRSRDLDRLRVVGLGELRARCSTTRASGSRVRNTAYFVLVGGPLSIAVSLARGAAARRARRALEAVLPHRALPARGDDAGRGRGRVALPLPPARRAPERGCSRAVGVDADRLARRSACGPCPRSSCSRCGRTSASTCSSSWPACRAFPERLYEAARLDGAGAWQQFRHVTLPVLAPTFVFVVVIDDDRLLPALRRAVRDDAGRAGGAHAERRAPHVRGGVPLVEHGHGGGDRVRALRHHSRRDARAAAAATDRERM